MKKNNILLLILLFFIIGCGKSETAKDNNKIIIGSADSDAEIWQFIADSDAAKDAGLDIEIKEVTGGPQLNNATVEGQVDVNAFQSLGYLQSFDEDSDGDLVPIATTYMEPMGIYSDKYTSTDEVEENAVVAIADNPANTARGLKLLQTAGLIKLSDDFNGGTGTVTDVVENPKNLEFKLIDDTTGPRILQDVDLALISNTIAYEGGLNVLQDSIFKEKVDDSTKLSINVLAVKEENKDNTNLKKLAELYHSDEVKEYIQENFGGTKVDVNEDASKLWEEIQ